MDLLHSAARITLFPVRGGKPFDMIFYGLTERDLRLSGSPVRAALKMRGLSPDAFTTGVWFVKPARGAMP